jgi:hypothetical protein
MLSVNVTTKDLHGKMWKNLSGRHVVVGFFRPKKAMLINAISKMPDKYRCGFRRGWPGTITVKTVVSPRSSLLVKRRPSRGLMLGVGIAAYPSNTVLRILLGEE